LVLRRLGSFCARPSARLVHDWLPRRSRSDLVGVDGAAWGEGVEEAGWSLGLWLAAPADAPFPHGRVRTPLGRRS
jgi:hypothetical protein